MPLTRTGRSSSRGEADDEKDLEQEGLDQQVSTTLDNSSVNGNSDEEETKSQTGDWKTVEKRGSHAGAQAELSKEPTVVPEELPGSDYEKFGNTPTLLTDNDEEEKADVPLSTWELNSMADAVANRAAARARMDFLKQMERPRQQGHNKVQQEQRGHSQTAEVQQEPSGHPQAAEGYRSRRNLDEQKQVHESYRLALTTNKEVEKLREKFPRLTKSAESDIITFVREHDRHNRELEQTCDRNMVRFEPMQLLDNIQRGIKISISEKFEEDFQQEASDSDLETYLRGLHPQHAFMGLDTDLFFRKLRPLLDEDNLVSPYEVAPFIRDAVYEAGHACSCSEQIRQLARSTDKISEWFIAMVIEVLPTAWGDHFHSAKMSHLRAAGSFREWLSILERTGPKLALFFAEYYAKKASRGSFQQTQQAKKSVPSTQQAVTKDQKKLYKGKPKLSGASAKSTGSKQSHQKGKAATAVGEIGLNIVHLTGCVNCGHSDHKSFSCPLLMEKFDKAEREKLISRKIDQAKQLRSEQKGAAINLIKPVGTVQPTEDEAEQFSVLTMIVAGTSCEVKLDTQAEVSCMGEDTYQQVSRTCPGTIIQDKRSLYGVGGVELASHLDLKVISFPVQLIDSKLEHHVNFFIIKNDEGILLSDKDQARFGIQLHREVTLPNGTVLWKELKGLKSRSGASKPNQAKNITSTEVISASAEAEEDLDDLFGRTTDSETAPLPATTVEELAAQFEAHHELSQGKRFAVVLLRYKDSFSDRPASNGIKWPPLKSTWKTVPPPHRAKQHSRSSENNAEFLQELHLQKEMKIMRLSNAVKRVVRCYLLKSKSGKRRLVKDHSDLGPYLVIPLVDLPIPLDRYRHLFRNKPKRKKKPFNPADMLYMVIDIRKGFDSFNTDPEDQPYFGFYGPDGIYVPNRLVQGAPDSVAKMQSALLEMFAAMIGINLEVYIDDFLLYADTETELLEAFEQLLQIAEAHDLKFAVDKVQIGSTVRWGSGKFTPQGACQASSRHQVSIDLPELVTAADLSRFLGVLSFLNHNFVGFARLTLPLLTVLTEAADKVKSRKGTKLQKIKLDTLNFDEPCQKAVANLRALAHAPLMQAPYQPDKAVVLFADAATDRYAFAVGQCNKSMIENIKPEDWATILDNMSRCPDAFPMTIVQAGSGVWHGSQKNWDIQQKEIFAPIIAMQEARDVLIQQPFLLVSDNQNTVHWFKSGMPMGNHSINVQKRLVRAAHIAGSFTYEAVLISGELNYLCDLMSRQQRAAYIAHVTPDVPEDIFTVEGAALQDLAMGFTLGEIDHYEANVLMTSDFSKEQILSIVISAHHATVHGAIDTMAEYVLALDYKIEKLYNWCKYVKKHCFACQAASDYLPHREMGLTETPEGPNQIVHADVLYLKKLRILVVRDAFSNAVSLTLLKDLTAETMAKHLYDYFASVKQDPIKVISDGGSEFRNDIVAEAMALKNIAHEFCAPGSSWSNGKVENANLTIVRVSRLLFIHYKIPFHTWPQLRLAIQNRMNTTTSEALAGYAPIEVHSGIHIISPGVYPDNPETFSAEDQALIHERVKAEHMKRKEQRINRHEQHHRLQKVDFSVGDYVMVYRKATYRSKVDAVWYGPFKVMEEEYSNYVFVVKLIEELGGMTYRRHIRHLKRFWGTNLIITQNLIDSARYILKGRALVEIRRSSATSSDEYDVYYEGADEPEVVTKLFLQKFYPLELDTHTRGASLTRAVSTTALAK